MNPVAEKLTDEEYSEWLLSLIKDGHSSRSARRLIVKTMNKRGAK